MPTTKQIAILLSLLFAFTVIIGGGLGLRHLRREANKKVMSELESGMAMLDNAQDQMLENIEDDDVYYAARDQLDEFRGQREAMIDEALTAHGIERSRKSSVSGPVKTVKRVDGAFYPEDLQVTEPEPTTSWSAVLLAGVGGLVVFGFVGIGAWQVLRQLEPAAPSEEESATQAEALGGDAEDGPSEPVEEPVEEEPAYLRPTATAVADEPVAEDEFVLEEPVPEEERSGLEFVRSAPPTAQPLGANPTILPYDFDEDDDLEAPTVLFPPKN